MLFEELTQVIQNRRSHYAYDFIDKKISKDTIEKIVNNGIWAPTHKLTQPWRFVVLEGEHHKDLGKYMANYYREIYTEEEFSNQRFEETKSYPEKATLLVLIFQPSKRSNLPEWEEIAAISCAVQNMWLSCTSLNIGSYWDTGIATINYINDSITLEDNEKCLGVFYMGYLKDDLPKVNRKRKPLSKKISWHKR
ncbi:nitroreductase family protein [Tenacibaculum sp. nBUS_03]|uniref:nitroreductase family protein n=1 Tax=Tenacibaculum sp. nBUS_03 TaxID=3395320 RepID=UPI003EB94517